jgi:hypothetical protein
MGLVEKRKMMELREVTFPERVKEIGEICGSPIPYDVDWDSLTDDGEAMRFIDNLSCHRVNMALRMICQDELGKSAVRDGLKKIRLVNVKTDGTVTFKDGTLEIHCNYAAGGGGIISDNEIRRVLEAGL